LPPAQLPRAEDARHARERIAMAVEDGVFAREAGGTLALPDDGGFERRLAAILIADVAGYSRLVGADGAGTLARWKEHWRALIDPKIAEHKGRLVRIAGDGLLVEFASVVAAVRCAIEFQRAMAERNAGVAPEHRIEFRVGINVGDIIIHGDDIWGEGVNV